MEETLGNVASAATETFTEQTSAVLVWLKKLLTWNNLFKLIGIVLVFAALRIIYSLIVKAMKKVPAEKVNSVRQQTIRKFVKYLFYVLFVLYVLSAFGVKLSAIWGAAGIAGVAIGFAAQTTVSNLISGLFVLTEGSLKIGDTIVVGDVTGIVDAVSLFSIGVHTFDNQMVRIPNSTIINSNMINNTYHKVRRFTVKVSVAYNTDMSYALETLKKAPALCSHVLQDPAPGVWYDGFGASGIELTVAVWFNVEDLITVKNEIFVAIKQVLDEARIEIPYDKLDVFIKETV